MIHPVADDPAAGASTGSQPGVSGPTADVPAVDRTPAEAALDAAIALLREQLDRAHRRNDELMAESRSRADDPLIRDLLMVVDSCARNAATWAEKAAAAPIDVAEALRGVAEDLVLVLERVGVEAFEPEPGAPFDRRSARAVRVQAVDDPDTAGRVVLVLRPGYRSGERVIRYAEVVVGRVDAEPL
jgi:molecular chaperone GrpE (heat shock protein)